MKVRLYLNLPIQYNQLVELNKEKSHYIQNVLRLKNAAVINVFNEKNGEFTAIVQIHKKQVNLKILEQTRHADTESKVKVNLAFANIKNNLTSDILNSCTQIGIDSFFPIITQNTVNHNFSTSRGLKILEEATEQSNRLIPPKLHDIQTFIKLVKNLKETDLIIFCDEKSINNKSDQDIEISNNIKNIYIFIGPEGGFTKQERQDLLNLSNTQVINLGKFILRAETAAICASFLITKVV